jgi:hypothetical protein
MGRKVKKALYLQSKERTGKGVILNDVLKAILGDRMYKTNSVESILKYTKPFEGCCLLNFDELPHCDNFKGLQDCNKSLITEPTFNCRDMFSTGYEQKNTFNIIITTNNDAVSLTQTNKERYVCLDINESKIGDHEYFRKLVKAIKSTNVLENFYNQMKKRYNELPEDWYGDAMPFTENRKMKIIEALTTLYKFLKSTYILKNKDINVRTDKFLEDYKTLNKDFTSSQKIGRMLTEIGIKPVKNSNNQGYNYKKSAKELFELFKSKNWIDETIDLINVDECDQPVDEEIEEPPNMFITELDKAEYVRAEDYQEQIYKIETLRDNMEMLSDEHRDMCRYIKRMESHIMQLEHAEERYINRIVYVKEKKPKKKAPKLTVIADGVVIDENDNVIEENDNVEISDDILKAICDF